MPGARGPDARLEIGFVRRAHGIRGELAIVTHDPESELLADVEAIWIAGRERRVTAARATPQGWLIALADVPDRTTAETLQGQAVEVARELVPLEDGEVILDDLIGCEARLPSGESWGTIVAIDMGHMQDRLVVHFGDRERLLPVVDQFVGDVDLEAGVVTVTPPDGLPDAPIPPKAR